jgi:twinkle protein
MQRHRGRILLRHAASFIERNLFTKIPPPSTSSSAENAASNTRRNPQAKAVSNNSNYQRPENNNKGPTDNSTSSNKQQWPNAFSEVAEKHKRKMPPSSSSSSSTTPPIIKLPSITSSDPDKKEGIPSAQRSLASNSNPQQRTPAAAVGRSDMCAKCGAPWAFGHRCQTSASISSNNSSSSSATTTGISDGGNNDRFSPAPPSPPSPPTAAPKPSKPIVLEDSVSPLAPPLPMPTSPSSSSNNSNSNYRASMRDLLNKRNFFPPSYTAGEYRITCPRCKGGNGQEKSLALKINPDGKTALYNCFRATCGYAGSFHIDQPSAVNDSGYLVSPSNRKRKEEPPIRPQPQLEPLTEEMVEFFEKRGISKATLERNNVQAEKVWVPGGKSNTKEYVIAFPYMRDGNVVNIKYRTLDKKFWQVKGAEKIMYGLEDIDPEAGEVIIVEGEMDKLALEEAGFRNVLSVPDGAPARVKDGDLPPVGEDTKFSYLWACRAWLDSAVKVIIATDNDAPGEALAEELARRLGRERCWRARWPFNEADHQYAAGVVIPATKEEELTAEDADPSSAILSEMPLPLQGQGEGELLTTSTSTSLQPSSASNLDPKWYRKDANEVLIRDGPAQLKAFIESADPLPIRGLLRFADYYDDIRSYYYLQYKDGFGVSTGWPSLDQYYRVVPGELTIVTGVPNSGKSEWLDALSANLSDIHGWTFAMCSMEKKATDHARQLAEKYIGKPFFDLPYARGIPRMTPDELDKAIDWVDDRFFLIRYEDDQLPSVDWVLDIAKAAVYRYGIRGLVIDPYNELDHRRPESMNETEYVSQMLTKVKRFAQTAGVHVWFVAHPRQLREWKGQAPNLYDISGSAHFINKADNGIVIHRNRDPSAQNKFEVQVLVRKVRNKAAGMIGDCVLHYERVNGRYVDPWGNEVSGGGGGGGGGGNDMGMMKASTAQRIDFGQWKEDYQRAEQELQQMTDSMGLEGDGGGERKRQQQGLKSPMAFAPSSTQQQQGERVYLHEDGTISSLPSDVELDSDEE